jgi:hypothetical protein
MSWEKPSFHQIEMNAEIGSYQDDFDNGPDWIAPDTTPAEVSDEPA